MPNTFKDKSILITGGTGSFGRAFARNLLQEDECKKVIIFSRDEWKQWEMQQSDPLFNSQKMRYFLGDVRDKTRLERAFNGVDFVVHTAALKQVPAAEYNPSEFVKTNVDGAMNVIDAAIASGVKKVIALSSDKAVNPVNLYGATKLCADKIFIAANSYVGARGYPIFSVVRYGNVLGSRGSILVKWQQLIKEGAKALPLTDDRMTRFWITLEGAVQFVKDCLPRMRGWEIFVPKIPSMKMEEMAKALAPKIPLDICGIRPGEKLHEVLMNSEEGYNAIEYGNYFMILPYRYAEEANLLDKYLKDRPEGKKVAEGFAYASNTNTDWLSKEAFLKLI